MQPEFLELTEVLYIHADQIERYGGDASIRDAGLLESAVAMPRAAFGGEFLNRDLFEMAAAYLFHIVQNHPFVDGNKRTGTATALVFLEMNGVAIDADEDELVALVLDVAQSRADKARIAEFFRANSE
jgi:death-on-curing protein